MPVAKLTKIIADREAAINALQQRLEVNEVYIAGLEKSLSRYIQGKCCCPSRHPDTDHFPGCPMTNINRIKELERELVKSKMRVV